jgi:precorrin-4 methylase
MAEKEERMPCLQITSIAPRVIAGIIAFAAAAGAVAATLKLP